MTANFPFFVMLVIGVLLVVAVFVVGRLAVTRRQRTAPKLEPEQDRDEGR